MKRKYITHLFLYIGIICSLACSSRNKSSEKDAPLLMKENMISDGVQRMQVSEAENSFVYRGKEYHSQVSRRPDDALPVVVNEQGDRFADNSISLRLRTGGKTIVDKVFTKEYFSSLVDADFLAHAILEGMVYDKVTSAGIHYAASICYPQTDLYIPLLITISAEGKISVTRNELLQDDYDSGKE